MSIYYNDRGQPITGEPGTYSIDDVRRLATDRAPYYYHSLSRLRIVASGKVPTMATSADWVTYYNPERLAKDWTLAQAAAVLTHELGHLLRRHSERCGDRDHKRFNIAGDAEINQHVKGLPDGAVYPSSLGMPNGLTAEMYYGATNDNGNQDGSGDSQPGDGPAGDGAPDCGSAADGIARDYEGGMPGLSQGEQDDAIKATAQDILTGRGMGKADAEALREWAETALHIDRAQWYSALAAAVGTTLSTIGAPTRWRWPGRRDIADMGGAMLPRWTAERPSCAVIIDTSSSISPTDLDMAVAAGHFIGRMADVTYYGCNTRPTKYGASLPPGLHGGGGTDLRNGITAAVEDGARAIVLITDCFTMWPAEPLRIPLIVGGTPGAGSGMSAQNGRDGSPYQVPEWAVYIPIVD